MSMLKTPSKARRSTAYHNTDWEAGIERHSAFNLPDVLGSEGDIECLDVAEEVLNLAAADDREDIGNLLHDVRNGHCTKRTRAS